MNVKKLAEESWEGCDGCDENDKYFWTKGFLSGHSVGSIDLIEFLIWLKENHWHVYKNGKWFTTTDQPYIDGEPRKTYTEEQVIKKYKEDGKENNN